MISFLVYFRGYVVVALEFPMHYVSPLMCLFTVANLVEEQTVIVQYIAFHEHY